MQNNEQIRQFTGVFVPAHIYLDNRLSPLKRLLLAEIVALDPMRRGCTASNGHFAAHFQCKPNTMSEHLSDLERLGFILIDQGKTRRIFWQDSVAAPAVEQDPIKPETVGLAGFVEGFGNSEGFGKPEGGFGNPESTFGKTEAEIQSKDNLNTLSNASAQEADPHSEEWREFARHTLDVERWVEANRPTFDQWHQVRKLPVPTPGDLTNTAILVFLGHYRSEHGREHLVYTDPVRFFINRFPKWLGMSKDFQPSRLDLSKMLKSPPTPAATDVNSFYK